jgi:hypothetical protein
MAYEFEHSVWDMSDKEFEDKIKELLEENERRKKENKYMSNEDTITQKYREYVNNTFICPRSMTDKKGETSYKTREEFDLSINKKLTNKDLYEIERKNS